MPADPQILTQLNRLLTAIRAVPDPRRATAEWKQVFNQLKKTDADANHVANVVAMRGVDQLAALIERLSAAPRPEAPAEDGPGDGVCQAAMKAFKKRLKLTRLDDESRLDSRDPLSKGTSSRVSAIQPPVEWPAEVWDELVRRGKLRPAGRGFYELAGE